MTNYDIAIIGGGLAGATTAAMLGRAGISAVMIDPHEVYPQDFRCEKIAGAHTDALRRTGLADAILPNLTFDQTIGDGTTWISRFGRLVDRRPGDQYGTMYEDLVSAMRAAIPASVPKIHAKAISISTGTDRQKVVLSDGQEIGARLVVLANGLNVGLRHALGIARNTVSPCHSITVGFNMRPANGGRFPFGSLTHYTEDPVLQMAYITLFPVGDAMRANLFTYRSADDPWLREMRQTPVAAMAKIMPSLSRITGPFEVEGTVRVRPADLYVTEGHLQPGIVLVGDAFATSCPAAGTGTYKVFTDVGQLCNVHIPAWLATGGMGVDKIAAFYDDPVKRACDAFSTTEAYKLRSMSIDDGLVWSMHRWARFAARSLAGYIRRVRPDEMSPPRAA